MCCHLCLSCRLEELFLCLNEYSSVSASSVACPTLRLLHITDNSLKDWAEVRKFGSMFPSLDTLVMANNNLASIQDSKDILQRLFPNLRSINLHNSGQWSQWSVVIIFEEDGMFILLLWSNLRWNNSSFSVFQGFFYSTDSISIYL